MAQTIKKKYVDKLPLSSKIRRLMWGIINLLFFRYTPRPYFNQWRVLLLEIFGASAGIGCKIDPSCVIWAPWNLIMGDYVCLAGNTDIYTVDVIKIGSNVTISQRAFICTGSHDITSLSRPLISRPIIIENNVWVCAESFISPGVKISEGAIVAARSVVTKDVAKWSVVAGNPAKFVKKRTIVE